LSDWETVRFEECYDILFQVIHSTNRTISNSEFGLIFSDIPINKELRVIADLTVKYESTQRAGNVQVHVLSLSMPKDIGIFSAPNLGEAIACLLSFSFRSRFTASRHWAHAHEGKITIHPMDAFYRLSSVVAGPLAIHPLSEAGIGEGTALLKLICEQILGIEREKFNEILRSLRLYQLGLLSYSTDIGLAYSLLVSAVDNLSCRLYNSEETSSTDKFVRFIDENLPPYVLTSFDSRAWEEDRWLESITSWKHSIIDDYRKRFEEGGEKTLTSLSHIFNERTINKIKQAFIEKKELSASEKKVYDHILSHWDLYRMDSKLTKEELPVTLKRIYHEVRSAFFHGGRSPERSAIDRYERAPFSPKINGNNQIEWQRGIPSFYYFERIAHESIINYISKLNEKELTS
jgi:hypothetical protein